MSFLLVLALGCASPVDLVQQRGLAREATQPYQDDSWGHAPEGGIEAGSGGAQVLLLAPAWSSARVYSFEGEASGSLGTAASYEVNLVRTFADHVEVYPVDDELRLEARTDQPEPLAENLVICVASPGQPEERFSYQYDVVDEMVCCTMSPGRRAEAPALGLAALAALVLFRLSPRSGDRRTRRRR